MKKTLMLLALVLIASLAFASGFEVTMGLSPVSSSFVDFYKGNGIEGAKSFMASPLGSSVSLEAFWSSSNGLGVSVRGGASVERKMETVFPSSFNMYYDYGLLGVGMQFALSEDSVFLCGLEAGLGAAANANVISRVELVALKGGIRHYFQSGLSLGVSSHILGIVSLNPDPYYQSVALQTESLVLDLGWRF